MPPTHFTASKKEDAEFTYSFVGWEPEFSPVTSDQTYTAVFSKERRTYAVRWLDEDGSVLYEDYSLPYGTTPVYPYSLPIQIW